MNLSEVNWDVDSAGTWPFPIKLAAVILTAILVVGLWIYFDTQDQLAELEKVENEEVTLKSTFETKQRKAALLDDYKIQLAEITKSFGTLLKQLPNKTEVANLLVDVSQTGLASGLEFELFKPKGETKKEFYAELPIGVRVVGKFEEFGTFVSGLASLPRIVTIDSVNITQKGKVKAGQAGESQLIMDAVVKTYRYLEEGGVVVTKSKRRRR